MTLANLGPLAALIKQRRQDVLSKWRKAVRELPSARHLDTSTLDEGAAFHTINRVFDQAIGLAVQTLGRRRHRRSLIQRTAGPRESALHLLLYLLIAAAVAPPPARFPFASRPAPAWREREPGQKPAVETSPRSLTARSNRRSCISIQFRAGRRQCATRTPNY